MNKIFYLPILFMLAANCAYAQNNIGVKLGLNISNVHNSNDNDFSTLPGFNAGIVARFKISSNILLNTEALFSNKGFNSELTPSGTTANRLNYLSFPVLLHYAPADKIYFQAGPEFNFLINAKMKNSTLNKSVADDYKTFDCSLAAGLGVKVFKKFNVETRYSYGLSNVRQDENIYGRYKNRTLQINLIYLLKSK